MIQFLTYKRNDNNEIVEFDSEEFSIISGKTSLKFFLKRFLFLFLFIYSTLFLAVALPFVKTPFMPIYFVGGMATCFYLIRLINHIIKFIQLQNAVLTLSSKGAKISYPNNPVSIPVEDITYFEHNLLGNFLIREKFSKLSFPLMLLEEEDREKLLGLFHDMAPNRTNIYQKIWETVDAIVVALVLAVHIIQYVIQAYFIPTGSMEDTLRKGDHLFVEKLTYGPIIPKMLGMSEKIHLTQISMREVNRGDIVIFRPPHEKDKDYIKRCIAIPGDDFDIRDGYVYINGKKQIESYVKDITMWPSHNFDSDQKKIKGIVPAGKVIVLGDNRTNSQDSRFFGYLDISRIKGRAFVLYWNTKQLLKFDFSRFGLIR